VVTVGDVTEASQYGLSIAPEARGQYPILRMMNLVDGHVVENDIRFVDLPDGMFSVYQLESGDVLFNRTNSIDLVGRTGVYTLEGEHVFASYLVRLKVKRSLVNPEYLTAYLNAPLGRQQVLSYATKAVSQANVSASNLAKVLIPLPPRHVQDRIVTELASMRRAQGQAKEHAQRAAEVKYSLIRRLADYPKEMQ
jgi:restriction endonuclease S subunit